MDDSVVVRAKPDMFMVGFLEAAIILLCEWDDMMGLRYRSELLTDMARLTRRRVEKRALFSNPVVFRTQPSTR